jgi:monothiol glutaredoxin
MDPSEKERILGLTRSNRVVLFMKGNKMFPQCGFSAHVVGILKASGVDFDAHNILADPGLRQGLKELSNWPTYPQLYVDGELVGGCDIISEMHESGKLQDLLSPA